MTCPYHPSLPRGCQEYKEITDPGSEPAVDPEALRRFLDTDDYRHFIDSLSDCTSSQVSGAPPARPPLPPRRLRRKVRGRGQSAAALCPSG